MTQEFLLFADLVLLLRLALLLTDAAAETRAWWTKGVAEISAMLVLLNSNLAMVGGVVVSVLASAAAVVWQRRKRDRDAGHLLIGLGQLVALSFCLGPAGGAEFRPWCAGLGRALTHWSALGSAANGLVQPRTLRILFGLLLAANEANLLIRCILGRLQLRPGHAADTGVDSGEYARGRVIGLLERALIYSFVLGGQYGAVGFTLAAKGFTRFKELENRLFAEYVLIGTLLSSGLAMAIALAVRGPA